MVLLSFVFDSITNNLSDVEKRSSGFDIIGQTGYANPIPDINAAIAASDDLDPADFEEIASFSGLPIEIRQEGISDTSDEPADLFISGADSAFLEQVTYEFSIMAEGYETADDVWQALNSGEDVVVASALIVHQRSPLGSEPDLPFWIEGFYLDEEVIPETFVTVTSPISGQSRQLQVIGILGPFAQYTGSGLLLTSQSVLNEMVPVSLPPTQYLFKVSEGVDAAEMSKTIERSFVEHSMQTADIASDIVQEAASMISLYDLIEGFMTLSLIVGVAALGVIAARSVVERRHQIGVLRAIGFQSSMVQFSFMLESSFIAVVGLIIGVALALRTAKAVIEGFSTMLPGMEYDVPGFDISIITGVVLVASLLITLLAARQTTKLLPADALRYVE